MKDALHKWWTTALRGMQESARNVVESTAVDEKAEVNVVQYTTMMRKICCVATRACSMPRAIALDPPHRVRGP